MALTLPETEDIPTKSQDILKMITDLSLHMFFPSKITIVDVRKINRANIQLCDSELPWVFLNKLIMLNYTAREVDLCSLYESRNQDSSTQPDSDDELFEDTAVNSINPCDLLYMSFLCCDPLLKLEFIAKLFTCRLAIPFIYRDSEGQLILSQWALRTILLDKPSDQKSVQLDALHCETKIVSFVRLGRQGMSKSKIINEVLCIRYHAIFFNRDCPLGTSQRKVSGGMVEASWYIPSGKENDNFNEQIMCLNLRGNCMEFAEELEALCHLSHVIVIHISAKELLSEREKAILTKIHQYNLPVVYALDADINTVEQTGRQPNQIWKEYKHEMVQYKSNIKLLNLKTSCQARSSSDVTKNMRKLLSEILTNKSPIRLVALSKELGISDEDVIPKYRNNKHMALEVLSTISENLHLEKENILPLQGQIWFNCCEASKNLFKAKSDEDMENLKSRIVLSRSEQIYKLRTSLHPFMRLFVKHLQSNLCDTPLFLCWIKILLDEQSRNVLPQLLFEYQQLWLSTKSPTERQIHDVCLLKERVDRAEQKLVDASFGLEHMMRELGQIYESVKLNGDFCDPWIHELPKITSKLIQQGYPFEIMDGDTAMIPVLWVQAVLQQLATDTGDKKILTISVLGIQSSGKSTLLNAMFGLQFAVSAGRCTRGVFAQLVKVANGILPYEHVLIIDTEGLRAPELADQKHSHDNKLATFVLGLGNITIINIKGENTAEIEDVLQIAIHAFLRLQMANMKLKLQQTCIFVHQNVPSIDASTKMTHARQKMMDKLDMLTCEAAKHEGLSDVYSFSQVLEINTESHVWYFSDLWSGDPPMATINLGYSESVNHVRQKILFDFGKKKKNILSLSETTSVIADLWNGILSDNFVFSFRNSLEVKAHQLMETQFQKIIWGIEKDVQQFIQQKAATQIARCKDSVTLGEVQSDICDKLERFLVEKEEFGEEIFNNFIDKSSHGNIMDQWRQYRIFQLKEYISNLILSSKNEVEIIKNQHWVELRSSASVKTHEQELRTKAQDLAKSHKGKTLSHTTLSEIFDDMWTKWISELQPENKQPKKPVQIEVKSTLFQIFNADRALLSKELNKVNKTDYHKYNCLKDSIPRSDVDETHIRVLKESFVAKFSRKIALFKVKRKAFNLINTVFDLLDNYLCSLISDGVRFENAHAVEVFMILKQSLDEHNDGIGLLTKFTVTTALRIKLAVHVFMYVTVFFKRMDERSTKTRCIVAKIEKDKRAYFMFFNNQFKSKTDEQIVANLIQNSIIQIVKNEIEKAVPLEIKRTIIYECFTTKYSLILYILKELAKEEDFEKYSLYIDNAKTFALRWITSFTKSHIFDTNTNRYDSIVERIIKKYMYIIESNLQQAMEKSTIAAYNICNNVLEDLLSKELPVPLNTFQSLKPYRNVDYLNVYSFLQNQLPTLENCLRQTFITDQRDSFQREGKIPFRDMFDKLWGCSAVCPFCREPCQKTSKHHINENHTCIQHRPPGVRGVRYENSDIMTWQSCNFLVYSQKRFYCGVADLKCQKSGRCNGKGFKGALHEYRGFQKLIPDWEVEPSPIEDSGKYWKWFIYRFRDELAEKYDYIIPRNVQNWKLITKQDAIDSLAIFSFTQV